MKIQTTFTFTEQHLSNILVTAFEGGVGHWCQIVKFEIPEGAVPPAEIEDIADFKHGWAPLVEGGGIWVQDTENPGKNNPDAEFQRTLLDRAALESGLTLCAKHHPNVFARIMDDGQYDAGDADIVIQLAIMGGVVFG
jgi:hypothetical protein